MAKKQTTPIVINDVEYTYEDMTEKQQVIVNHCADLDRKIKSTQFNLDQLMVGKDAFVQMLTVDLEVVVEEEEAAQCGLVQGNYTLPTSTQQSLLQAL